MNEQERKLLLETLALVVDNGIYVAVERVVCGNDSKMLLDMAVFYCAFKRFGGSELLSPQTHEIMKTLRKSHPVPCKIIDTMIQTLQDKVQQKHAKTTEDSSHAE